MGARGPIGHRSGDLSRERDANRNNRPPVTKGALRDSVPWQPDPAWSDFTKRVYRSLMTSGIADFYQDSDWAAAHIIFSELDVYRHRAPMRRKNDEGKWEDVLDPATGEVVKLPYHKPSGQMFQAIWSALTSLGMTEGDRRRMRIELESPAEESNAEVLAIADYKADLGLA